MSFRSARLGIGDWLTASGSVGLIVDLFLGTWFSYPNGWHGVPIGTLRAHLAENGWNGLPWLGPVTVVIAACGILAFGAQALRRSPAIPTVLTTLIMPAAVALTLVLAVRVLIAAPDAALRRVGVGGSLAVDAGAYAGLGLSVVLAIGLYVSLRREGVAAADVPTEIETIRLDAVAGPNGSRTAP